MALFKVGLLSTVPVFVVAIIISTRAEEYGTSQSIEKPWYSRRAYPIGESIEAGRNPISGSNMPYIWQNSKGKTNMPLDTYEHNPQNNDNNNEDGSSEHTENVLTWNGPTLIEHTLKRDPLTGKLYVFKVTKYRRDNYGWIELWNSKNSYNMYETDKAKQSKPVMTLSGYTSGEHKQIEKQLNNDIYKYHSRSYQYEDVTRNQEPAETGDNIQSGLLNILLKRPVPSTDSPLAGIVPYSENEIQNENNKYKEHQLENRSEESLDTSIYHRRATICVVNGDPEKCRKVMQIAMYLKTILDSQRALKHSHIEENIKSMHKNLNNMWKKGETLENWYFKMLSQFIGKGIGMPENNFTQDSLEQKIVGEVLNLWDKIFGEASDDIRNNEVSSEGKDTAEELTLIWKNLLNNYFNRSATKDIPAQMNVTENTDNFIFNLPASLLTIVRYILNDFFSNKTIEEDGTSMTQYDYLLQDIVYLWKVLMSTINVSNILFPHFEQILLQTKNTSEFFLSTLLKQLDLWDENIALIESLKKIWESVWHEIFSYLSDLQSRTGHVLSEQGMEDLNAHQWEKLIWNILSKSIYGSEEENNLNKYPENVNITSVTETTAAITINTQNISDTGNNINSSHTYYGNPEIHKNNTKIEADYSWEDVLHEIASKLQEINGTFFNPRTDIPHTTIVPEDHVEETIGKTNDNILKMISHKFESAENVQYGSIKDNYWEEMMHEILNTENEIRNNDAKDEENDIWLHLKKHFNMTTNKDNNENKNYIWQYFVNGMLGSDPEVDSDMYFGHMSAMEYIKQWVENYTNPIFGQDEIWNQLFNDTETAETEIATSQDYNSTHAVTAPVFDTSTSQEFFNGTSEPSLKDTIEPASIPVELQNNIGLYTGTGNLTVNN